MTVFLYLHIIALVFITTQYQEVLFRRTCDEVHPHGPRSPSTGRHRKQDQRLDWGGGTCLGCAGPGLNVTAKGSRVSLGPAQIPTPAAIIANVSIQIRVLHKMVQIEEVDGLVMFEAPEMVQPEATRHLRLLAQHRPSH